jgi:hypothetical protein
MQSMGLCISARFRLHESPWIPIGEKPTRLSAAVGAREREERIRQDKERPGAHRNGRWSMGDWLTDELNHV